MVAKSTEEHFAEYTPNTRIKHEILKRYLKVYLTALSNRADAFHYIDGFAGRGHYGGKAPGSPLLALELLGNQRLPYCASFVEALKAEAVDLRGAVAALSASGHQLDPPLVLTGEFADQVGDVLSRVALRPFRRVATFAFVDPCRVKGVRVLDIQKILAMPYGECLIFWNYDGVNRWLGAVSAGESSGEGLKDLFGDTLVLNQAVAISEAEADPVEKERSLLTLFIGTLKSHSGATHVLPFRFDARDRARTSHYLIHCATNGLAFSLMKEVMSSLSSAGEPGKFEFLGESDVGNQADMFRPAPEDVVANHILDELRKGPRPVKCFYEDWVRRTEDFYSESQYRQILLKMEERGLIEVVESGGQTPAPRERRRKRKGEPTLSSRYWVRARRN